MHPLRSPLAILTLGLLVACPVAGRAEIVHHVVDYSGTDAGGPVAFDVTDGSATPGGSIPVLGFEMDIVGQITFVRCKSATSGAVVITGADPWLAEKFSPGVTIDGSIPDAPPSYPGFSGWDDSEGSGIGQIRAVAQGNFASGERGYIGLRFQGNPSYYGWAEVSATDGVGWTVYQFAYEDSSAPIRIGDTGTAILIGFWDRPIGTIPSGWEAETSYGDRFVYGTDTGEEPLALGGSATHTHTVNAPSTQTGNDFNGPLAQRNLTTGLQVADHPHKHNVNVPAVTSGSASSLPELVQKLVLLRGDMSAAPSGLIGMWSGPLAQIPGGWHLCDGVVNNFDLGDRFVMATQAGEEPHAIDNEALHSHEVVFPIVTSGGPSATVPRRGIAGQVAASPNHTHQFAWPSFATDSTEILPPYVELAFLIHTGPPVPVPPGMILMYSGTTALLPPDWVFCDGTNGTPDLRDRFVRGTIGGEEPGAVGGSATHTHSVDPPVNSNVGYPSADVAQGLGATNIAGDLHGHSVDIPEFASGAASSLPPYVKLAFVMFRPAAVSAPEDGLLAAGQGLSLHAPYPNPVAAATTFRFEVARRSRVDLVVYDAAGRRVRSLASSSLEAGPHFRTWDRRSDSGAAVAAGVYFVRLSNGEDAATRKLTVLR